MARILERGERKDRRRKFARTLAGCEGAAAGARGERRTVGTRRGLVVAPQPFFTPRGTPLSVYYRTLVAAEQGVVIDLLTYGDGEDVDIPGMRIRRIPHFPFLGPVRAGPSHTKLFLDLWLILWTIGLLLRHRYDFVHAHEEAVFWCHYLKPLFRFKLAYDMHSSLPEQLKNFQFTNSKRLIRIFQMLERSALKGSDAVITVCPDLEGRALAHGVRRDRLFLIENSIFESVRLRNGGKQVTEQAPEHLASAPYSPSVVYAGTFEPYQGVDLLLYAFTRLHRERPNVDLHLVGGTPEQVEAMRTLAKGLGIGGVAWFTGRVSQACARAYIENATVLVSPRVEGTNTPLKIYELLASGKPLVATRIWSHTQVLNDEVCILVEPNASDLARGLIEALDDESESARRAVNARRLYENAYSRQVYESKMRRFLEVFG
jgi:glycosyltransferase involved in cell wall biosynthesis